MSTSLGSSRFSRRLGDVPDLTADPTLAEKELGFHAIQDLETMCRDLWNWQTKNPEGYTPSATSPTTTNTTNDWVKVSPAADVSKSKPDTESPTKPKNALPLPGSLVVEAPTIPSEREIIDPRTPAHLSPIHFEHPTNQNGGEKVQRPDLRPEDVFIGQTA